MNRVDDLLALFRPKKSGSSGQSRSTHYELSTRGGTIGVTNEFSITYSVDEGITCQLSKPLPGEKFVLSLIQSPSGSGKTTLLRELYSHIHRKSGSSSLNFDFRPDYTESSRIGCGFVPQHPPLVKHWKCRSLLPAVPKFLDIFFPELSVSELADMQSKRIGQLSGGQARRLLACSALEKLSCDQETSASFLLLDETFDGIGARALVSCMNLLRDRWLRNNHDPLHVLLVSHLSRIELGDCLSGRDLVVVMEVQERNADRIETKLRNLA